MTFWQTTMHMLYELVDILGHEIFLFLAVVLIHTLLFHSHLTGRGNRNKLAPKLNKAKYAERLQPFFDAIEEENWEVSVNEFKKLKDIWKFRPDVQTMRLVKIFLDSILHSKLQATFLLSCHELQLHEEIASHLIRVLVEVHNFDAAKELVCTQQWSAGRMSILLSGLVDAMKASSIQEHAAVALASSVYSWAQHQKLLDAHTCTAVIAVLAQAQSSHVKATVEDVLEEIKKGLRPSSALLREMLMSFKPRRSKVDSEASMEDRRRAMMDWSEQVIRVHDVAIKQGSSVDDPEVQKLVVDAALRTQHIKLVRDMVYAQDEAWQQSLIKTLGNQNRLQDVQSVFAACKEPTCSLFNALLDACVSCHDYAAAETVAEDAILAGRADIVTFNTLAKSRIKARMATETGRHSVSSVVDLMDQHGLKPNHVTCSILLKSLQKGVSSSEVEKVMHAVGTVEQDTASEKDDVLLSSVVEGCLRVDRVDLLLPWLRKWQTGGHVPVKRAYTYGSIIRAYGLSKDVQGAWEAWKQMMSHDIIPTPLVMGCMVEALVSNGDPDAAYGLVQQESVRSKGEKPVNSVIYGTMLKGFAHQKNFPKVWEVYQEMKQAKVDFSIVTYNTLVDACARCGQAERMQSILDDMQQAQVEPNIITLSSVLKGYCQDRKLEKAFNLLETIRASPNFKADEIIYNSLLDGCAREGLWHRALGLLDQMQKDGIKPSNFTLSVLTKCARRGGCSVVETVELCDSLASKFGFRLNVHVYANLIHLCADRRKAADASLLMQRMIRSKVRPDPRSYQLLIGALIAAKDVHEAHATLCAATRQPGCSGALMEAAQGDKNRLRPEPVMPRAMVTELASEVARASRLPGEPSVKHKFHSSNRGWGSKS